MVCDMNTIGESVFWPGVARLRLGLNDDEELLFHAVRCRAGLHDAFTGILQVFYRYFGDTLQLSLWLTGYIRAYSTN
jgi:hypothetical protein